MLTLGRSAVTADQVRRVMDTLAALAQVSDVARGRRVAVVFLGAGLDYNIFNTRDPGTTDVLHSMEDAIAALRRANVVLYAIDPRGLVSTEGAVVENRFCPIAKDAD